LQEVTPLTLPLIRANLPSNGCQLLTQIDEQELQSMMQFGGFTPYFTAMIVSESCLLLEHSVTPFQCGSQMCRSTQRARLLKDGCEFMIMNTHLESTKPTAKLRVQQANEILDSFSTIQPCFSSTCSSASSFSSSSPIPCLACGDLNIRDEEAAQTHLGKKVRVIFPHQSYFSFLYQLNQFDSCGCFTRLFLLHQESSFAFDAWERLGRPKNAQYTWDLALNNNVSFPNGNSRTRLRFDRIWCSDTNDKQNQHFQPIR
jgi:hypothetical protein